LKIKFIYPASYLKHKNHSLLFVNAKTIYKHFPELEFILTIERNEFINIPKNIKCIGRVSRSEVMEKLINADALLFLSSFESLGIPLIEAAKLSKPIIVPKLSYSKELIGENAYYFDLNKNFLDSFLNTLFLFRNDLKNNKVRKSILIPEIISTDTLMRFFLKKLNN
jgi:glycosyltransferase involved in cell wall biosynthesis